MIVITAVMIGWDDLVGFFFVANFLIDVVFILDLLVNCFTGDISEDANSSTDSRRAMKYYGWCFFLVDLLSGVPYDLFFVPPGLTKTRLYVFIRHPLKLLKAFRVPKLFAVQRTSRLFEGPSLCSLGQKQSLNCS